MNAKPNIIAHQETDTEKSWSVMPLLRTETASVHRRLERTRCFVRLFEPDYSIQEYQDLIAKFYGFFSALEPLIFGNLNQAHQAILGDRTKTALLAKDLVLMGLTETQDIVIPRCKKLPQLTSFARQMGALYVLEGSTLGGRVISKRLKEHFGEIIFEKLNYYQCYGDDLMVNWKSFQEFMAKQFDGNELEIQESINASIDTFTCLEHWLEHT
jgi:heme oxygenase (biliverdin-IX-beta and delta-forming)